MIRIIKHKDSKRYVPIWDLQGGGHVRRARRPDVYHNATAYVNDLVFAALSRNILILISRRTGLISKHVRVHIKSRPRYNLGDRQ